MHRSASTSRASDEFSINLSPAAKGSPGLKTVDIDKLPTYNPISDATKKETTTHLKSSRENVVHLIPLVLILCAAILWVFSHPVDVTNKGGLIVERVERLNINDHGNQTGFPSATKQKDLDKLERNEAGNAEIFLVTKSG